MSNFYSIVGEIIVWAALVAGSILSVIGLIRMLQDAWPTGWVEYYVLRKRYTTPYLRMIYKAYSRLPNWSRWLARYRLRNIKRAKDSGTYSHQFDDWSKD